MKYRQERDGALYLMLKDMPETQPYSYYGMPQIKATQSLPANLLPFNYAKICPLPGLYHICFYIDDYQFERIWREPMAALNLLKNFKGIIGPDFSIYRDMPLAHNIYNCWRNKMLMAFFQANGLDVIPNVSWATEDTYDWCFDGLPKNSVLAVSTNGCIKDKTAYKLFLKGYKEMVKRLGPTKVVLVGPMPKELQNEQIIVHFESYSGMFKPQPKFLQQKQILNQGGP